MKEYNFRKNILLNIGYKMKKVISFSVWGKDEKYIKGCYENILLAEKIYPGWICRFYCAQDVDAQVCKNLVNMGAEVCNMEYKESSWEGLFWRFLPAGDSDVAVFISRDIDSRLNERESAAVAEWLSSDKELHAMRDHIEHNVPILGGMWGCRNGILLDINHKISRWSSKTYKGCDQDFLRHVIFETFRSRILIHDKYVHGVTLPQSIHDIDDFKKQINYIIEQNLLTEESRKKYILNCQETGTSMDQYTLQNNFKILKVPEILFDEHQNPYYLYNYNPKLFFGDHDIREFPPHKTMSFGTHVGEIIS